MYQRGLAAPSRIERPRIMAATGNEVVLLRQLKDLYDSLVAKFITGTAADGKYAAKSHTHTDATTEAAGFMSAADKTKLNGLKNYTLPEATSTTLGGVNVATDEDAKAFLGY